MLPRMSPHLSQHSPEHIDNSDLDDDDDFYVSEEFPAAQKNNFPAPLLEPVSGNSVQRQPQQVYSHDSHASKKSPTFQSFPLPKHPPGVSGNSKLIVMDL